MQGPGAHTRQDAKRQEGHRSKKKPVHGPQRREMKRSEQTRDSGKGRSEFCRPHRGHGPWQPMPRGGGGGGGPHSPHCLSECSACTPGAKLVRHRGLVMQSGHPWHLSLNHKFCTTPTQG